MAENFIIKKKVEEWIQAVECLKKGIHAYEEEVDAFYDLFYVPKNDTVSKSYVEEKCALLGKLGSDIVSKDPELAAALNKFEGICTTYFKDPEKFKVFREELKKNSIFKEIQNEKDREKKREEEFKRQQQEELRRRQRKKEEEDKQRRQQEEELLRQRREREARERREREETGRIKRKKKFSKVIAWMVIIALLVGGAYSIIPTLGGGSKEEIVQPQPVIGKSETETEASRPVKEQQAKETAASKPREKSSSQTQVASSSTTKPVTTQVKNDTKPRQPATTIDVQPSVKKEQVTAASAPVDKIAETPTSLYNAGLTAYKQFKYDQAHTYFSKAANQGETNAQYYLGMMFLNGNGVKKNTETAFTYISQAAKKGHKEATYQLAQMYDGGWGTAKDKEQAKNWYKKAADQGNEAARRRLNNM